MLMQHRGVQVCFRVLSCVRHVHVPAEGINDMLGGSQGS
jgi:hypothetical protein